MGAHVFSWFSCVLRGLPLFLPCLGLRERPKEFEARLYGLAFGVGGWGLGASDLGLGA